MRTLARMTSCASRIPTGGPELGAACSPNRPCASRRRAMFGNAQTNFQAADIKRACNGNRRGIGGWAGAISERVSGENYPTQLAPKPYADAVGHRAKTHGRTQWAVLARRPPAHNEYRHGPSDDSRFRSQSNRRAMGRRLLPSDCAEVLRQRNFGHAAG